MSAQIDLLSICPECGETKEDWGNWLVCDDCGTLLRGYLKFGIDMTDMTIALGFFVSVALTRNAAT